MSTSDQPSEAELQAAYEAEIKKIRVEQIVLEQVVSLVNLGMRRTGLSPGTEDERDPGQVRIAIEAVRALLPLIEESAPPQASAIRDALSQLQLAYLRLSGAGEPGPVPGESSPARADPPAAAAGPPPSGPAPEPDPSQPGEPGPAQRSGRLWIPGQ
ncbi:MAG TPA: hypothetical protein VIK04_07840 [Solirubrobacteraceae bacterium]